jgi:hypothetical protein
MISLAIFAPSTYTDWDKFQSVVDSVRELHDIDYIVYTQPHKLIQLYCKIDCMQYGVNSLREVDKYDMALVFTSAKAKMLDTLTSLRQYSKPTVVYDSFQDEIEVIQ